MEVRLGYMQTEVGIIPRDWYITTLGELGATFGGLSGKTKRDFGHGAARYITFMNVMTNVMIDCETFELVDVKPTETQNQAAKGDLFFNGSSETPGEVGMCAVLADDVRGVLLNSFCFGFRLRGGAPAEGLYLAHYFRSREGRELMKSLAQGAIRYNLSKTALLKTRFPLPQRAEQEAIAEALSDADALIESLEQLLAKKRQLKKGAMQELLMGKKRLPGFSKEWKERPFGEIAQPRKDRLDSRRVAPQEFCIELEHIEQGTGTLAGYSATSESSSFKSVFQKDDVLFGKLRAYLRKYWLANREGVCSTEIWVLAAKRALLVPQFLFQLVMEDRFIEAASTAYGTHMPRSDWNVMKNYEVRLPSVPEQTAIAAILSDMDAELAALEAKLAKARELKQGMMQELLTGRIRLV